MTNELSITAHHEAGHVVSRFINRLPAFDVVTIDESEAVRLSGDPDAFGYVHVADQTLIDSVASVMMTGAGPAAEAYVMALADSDGDESTIAAGACLRLSMCRETHSEMIPANQLLGAGCVEWLVTIAEANWAAIEDIAAALLASDTGSLTYSECAALMHPHAPFLFEELTQ